MKLFVWEEGKRGPYPAIYHAKRTDGHGKTITVNPILTRRILNEDEEKLSLRELAVKYPLKGESSGT